MHSSLHMPAPGAAAFVAGTAAYNRYLSRWSYRAILGAVQLVLTAVHWLDPNPDPNPDSKPDPKPNFGLTLTLLLTSPLDPSP